MDKQKSGYILSIVALIVAVVGLAIGFSAFQNTLTITPSAGVTVDASDFNVLFSSSATEVKTTDVAVEGDGETPTIDNTSDPVISNLKARFTAPGQSVKYTFYALNQGVLDAWLKSVEVVENGGQTKVCSVITDETVLNGKTAATDSLVQEACAGINMTVKIGNGSSPLTFTNANNGITPVSNHRLNKGDYEKIELIIDYAASAARADGDFSVDFGNVKLIYSSVAETTNE